jgi:hypothetical protein
LSVSGSTRFGFAYKRPAEAGFERPIGLAPLNIGQQNARM